MNDAPRPITPEAFREMCKRHDLTFDYSDDSAVWRAGRDSLARIREAAKQLDRATAVRIWNEVVDEKMTVHNAAEFYWKP